MPVYVGDQRSAERSEFALGAEIAKVDSPQSLDAYLKEAPDEQLVIIGPDVSITIATELAERYRVARPSLGIVLARQRPDLVAMTQAMRAGVREVVAADDTAELASACRRSLAVSEQFRSAAQQAPSSGRGRLIVVFASKGGCGKTTVSTNLATSFAKAGGTKVCLVDFDLQFGDVGIALQLEPTRSVSDAIGMSGGVDDVAASSLVMRYRPNFDVLLAPPRPADAEFISADVAGDVLEGLLRQYDVVVVDSPPAFNDVVLRAFDMADEYVLITTLDMPALKSLKVSLDTLEVLGYSRDRWNIVLNRSDSRVGLTPDDVERAIGMSIPTRIPSSSAVPSSINQGVTLVESSPRHPVSRSIAGLADALMSKPDKTTRRPLSFTKRG